MCNTVASNHVNSNHVPSFSCQSYQRLQCRDKYFFKIKFVFFLYLRLSASSKENDLPLCIYFWYQTDSGIPDIFGILIKNVFHLLYHQMCNTVASNHVNSDHVPSFSCLDVWTNRQETSGVYAYYCDNGVIYLCYFLWFICSQRLF
jgi:hypothetical protein